MAAASLMREPPFFFIARQSGGIRETVNGLRERIERIGAPHVFSPFNPIQKSVDSTSRFLSPCFRVLRFFHEVFIFSFPLFMRIQRLLCYTERK